MKEGSPLAVVKFPLSGSQLGRTPRSFGDVGTSTIGIWLHNKHTIDFMCGGSPTVINILDDYTLH